MFILAHTGLTLGVSWLIVRQRTRRAISGEGTTVKRESYMIAACQQSGSVKEKGVDYRLILLGSILPDIIDKPIGLLAPWLGLGTGRGIAHTLLFALMLLTIGTYSYRRGRPGFLYMSLASCGHLILDRMWQMPRVLLWPLFGTTFPQVGKEVGINQIVDWWQMLFKDAWVYVPEIIGGVILFIFFVRLWRFGGVSEFVRSGWLC